MRARLIIREALWWSRLVIMVRRLPTVAPKAAPELGRELGRDLDVGEPGNPVPPEDRAAPPVGPDEAHGEGGAVLDLLVRPDLGVGLDGGRLADPA